MAIKIKNIGVMLVCAAAVIQLAGCEYDRHGRRSDDDHRRTQEYHQQSPELDIRVH